MKNTYNNIRVKMWAIVLLSSIMGVSCSQWDDYKKYTDGGEIVYPGNFQKVKIYSGKDRVRFTLLPTSDPKVTTWKVYWNDNKDSAVFDFATKPVAEFGGKNAVDTIISMPEGARPFKIYTKDAAGNMSVVLNASGTSYGAVYRRKIATQDRNIKSIDYDADTTIINWDEGVDFSTGPQYIQLKYSALTGDTLIVVPLTKYNPVSQKDELIKQTILKRFKYQTETFKYRTVFRPDTTCIDTFCTAYKEVPIPVFVSKELDRSLFKEYPLPGDVGPNGGWSEVGVRKMWDGLGNGYDHSSFTDLNGALQSSPSIVTFDLGLKAKLSTVWILPFRDPTWFSYTAMKRFEIWGSARPNSNGVLDASWYMLGSYTVVRPSGRAEGQPDTAEDAALASAGFTWTMDANAPKVRYLRIRCLESFRTGITAQSVGEIKVYGLLPK